MFNEINLGATIKFREPVTGKSFTRRFNPTDQIHILYDFVQSKFDEIQFESNSIIFELGTMKGLVISYHP
jgi:hypothetical protein